MLVNTSTALVAFPCLVCLNVDDANGMDSVSILALRARYMVYTKYNLIYN